MVLRKISALLLFLLLTPQTSWAQLVVGNCGDGIWINKSLYLRDLVEAGVHENPYMGPSENSYFLAILQNHKDLTTGLDLDETLLANKLSDLDSIVPGLSHVLLSSIRYYNWTITPRPLDGECEAPCPANRVVIGVRRSLSIFMAESLWTQLSPEQRIAFMIHEMFFSYAKVTCSKANECEQTAEFVRKVVGTIFSEPASRDLPALRTTLREKFSFTELENICGNHFFATNLKLFNKNGNQLKAEKQWQTPFTASKSWSHKVGEFCADNRYRFDDSLLVMDLSIPHLKISTRSYPSKFGPQLAAETDIRTGPARCSLGDISPFSCESWAWKCLSQRVTPTASDLISIGSMCGPR